MGVSYREELKKKKKKNRPSPGSMVGSQESREREQAKERATLRAQYFAVARRGRDKMGQAQARLIDG